MNLTEKEREQIQVQQARHVMPIINSEGWKIIEQNMEATKLLIEKDSERDMKLQSTREKGVYWLGAIHAINRIRENIYKIISDAQAIDAKEKLTAESWED